MCHGQLKSTNQNVLWLYDIVSDKNQLLSGKYRCKQTESCHLCGILISPKVYPPLDIPAMPQLGGIQEASLSYVRANYSFQFGAAVALL